MSLKFLHLLFLPALCYALDDGVLVLPVQSMLQIDTVAALEQAADAWASEKGSEKGSGKGVSPRI